MIEKIDTIISSGTLPIIKEKKIINQDTRYTKDSKYTKKQKHNNMSCYISDGYTLDCRNASIGGIKEMWILGTSGNTISGYTENASEQITSFSGKGTWFKEITYTPSKMFITYEELDGASN